MAKHFLLLSSIVYAIFSSYMFLNDTMFYLNLHYQCLMFILQSETMSYCFEQLIFSKSKQAMFCGSFMKFHEVSFECGIAMI